MCVVTDAQTHLQCVLITGKQCVRLSRALSSSLLKCLSLHSSLSLPRFSLSSLTNSIRHFWRFQLMKMDLYISSSETHKCAHTHTHSHSHVSLSSCPWSFSFICSLPLIPLPPFCTSLCCRLPCSPLLSPPLHPPADSVTSPSPPRSFWTARVAMWARD